MRTIIALLALASLACAAAPTDIDIAMAMERERHKHHDTPKVEPVAAEWNLSALTVPEPQPKPAPVVHYGSPNVGSCSCNRSGGQCWCRPASICPQGCPINQTIKALRPDEVRYYFPQDCPTGR